MSARRRSPSSKRPPLASLILLLPALVLAACGGDAPAERSGGGGRAALDATHVHGLAVDPADEALLIATHDGLFELGDGEVKRRGDFAADLMGFNVVDEARYVASGHPLTPDAGSAPHLGLVRTSDGGESWTPLSLEGEADFHALAAGGELVYGFNGLTGELLSSSDGGKSWETGEQIGAVASLAVDPDDPRAVVAAGEDGLFLSTDGAATWETLRGPPGLVAWSESGIYVVDAFGKVLRGDRRGVEPVGRLGRLPVALTAEGDRLWAMTDDGVLRGSTDRGASWSPLEIG